MTENLPDEELTIVGEEPEVPNDSLAPEAFDPVLEGQPDAYQDAAELNPDRWQEDPLLQDEPGVTESGADENGVAGVGEEGALSDQTLREGTAEARYEHGDEQYPPEEPMLGEAAADVDFGMMEDDDVDASDDPANRGGSPLNAMDQEDLR
ncbi:hypothetical protein ASF21_07740 [Arthrobacter sp. Leaf234]|uniref:hypothetical protein n=1 Tax=Arthrobacter sp. Leaf234 TaxID=1736303 RepID=UPI0006F6706A|nr:hypothetical protein [Arthrobacter sp. Leaf234]KQO01517.1 hypothetical protein ASF21_07740 [Arthrobacter sp. Leaf234]